MHKLSAQEKAALIKRHKKEKDGRIRDRLKVVLWIDEGLSAPQIAKLLFIQPCTVYQHLQAYHEENKIAPTKPLGTQSKLNPIQTQEVIAHLEEVTYHKVEDICSYVKDRYGVYYTVSGLTDWLKDHHFSYKKLEGVPAKADAAQQEAFVAKYRALEKKLPPEEDIIFIDSAHPTQGTKLGYGWIRTGTVKQVKTSASRSRVNITGGVNIQTKKVASARYPTINSETTISFLKQLLGAYPKSNRLHIILDRSGYHTSQAVKDYVQGTKIKLHYLPPYSPNLNPIERLWKLMNKKVRNNRYFTTAQEFRDALEEFFDKTIAKIFDEVDSLINSNCQRLKIAT